MVKSSKLIKFYDEQVLKVHKEKVKENEKSKTTSENNRNGSKQKPVN